jgi:glucosamine--fructose-6-phosphate aminotransferase (isomerizing)
MCGIVGYIGKRNATEVLVDGLKRLEYRGYDSAGIAVMSNGDLHVRRSVGKLDQLEQAITEDPPKGHIGVGHTRWATHGRPSEANAHPHRAGDIIVVHNGIIENHAELRRSLIKKGHEFSSETDTEIVAHLINDFVERGLPMKEAIKKSLGKIRGSYAFLIMNANDKESLYLAKNASPMVLGLGHKENFIASDIPALLPYTRKVIFLEDGEIAKITADSYSVRDSRWNLVKKTPKTVTWDPIMAEKGGYKHFMLKEIFEQPKILEDTFGGRVAPGTGKVILRELDPLWKNGRFPFDHIYIVACGTSWHASLIGKYWIERICRIPVSVDLASEFRYREPIITKRTLFIPISQSGETADTLAALQMAKAAGAKVLSICNVVDSSIARASNAVLYTHAGPEIGVASTKAFTAQLIALLLLSLAFGRKLGKIDAEFVEKRVGELLELPGQMRNMLKGAEKIKKIAEDYVNSNEFIFIARGVHYPVALEGALKLKEISYLYAEGFAAGELKHGPIALVDNGTPILALAPKGYTYDKVASNIEEVRARGADVIAIVNDGDRHIAPKASAVVNIPHSSWYTSPILYALPLQLFAYYIADHKGTDVDQPRNLAKSVTVE